MTEKKVNDEVDVQKMDRQEMQGGTGTLTLTLNNDHSPVFQRFVPCPKLANRLAKLSRFGDTANRLATPLRLNASAARDGIASGQ